MDGWADVVTQQKKNREKKKIECNIGRYIIRCSLISRIQWTALMVRGLLTGKKINEGKKIN